MLTKGDKIIAGTGTITPLLTSIWSDHILNDISWLRADTYSWQSGDVYVAAYEHLAAEANENPLERDVINGINIPFHRANDGHKIVIYNHTVPERDQLLTNLLNSSGSAWYYLLDTENRRFKLPRTKFGFTGLKDRVGDYVPESLPKPQLVMRTDSSSSTDADLDAIYGNNGYTASTPSNTSGVDEYMHRTYTATSNNLKYMDIIGNSYKDNAPVQQRATQMYLYFYVGQFTQTATEQTAGLNAELFNNKQDLLGNNVDYVIESQLPTVENNYTWYRKYKSGWVEQGGYENSTAAGGQYANKIITLPIEMADTNYTKQVTAGYPGNGDTTVTFSININSTTTTTFAIVKHWSNANCAWDWQVSGMAA